MAETKIASSDVKKKGNDAGPARQLWQRWRQGERPDVRKFLASAGELSPSQIASVLRVDQSERWQAGERITAESYLRNFAEVHADPEAAIDVIFGEFLLREELGEQPAPQEYLERFSLFAAQLQLQFDLHGALASAENNLTDLQKTRPFHDHDQSTGSEAATGAVEVPAIPGYEILSELGRGGMGVVYKARHLGLNRIVALKMVLNSDYATPDARARFREEATVLAKLQHPNIVQVFDNGIHDGNPYIALEFIAGGSLAQTLRGEPLLPQPAASFMETLARAVQAAHDCGIIHRDLKPANILLRHTESLSETATQTSLAAYQPKITDFGLAKQVSDSEAQATGLTESGAILGTPSYMAPEQAAGQVRQIGPATDVYSLGAILYELLTGRPPFRAATIHDTISQVIEQEPVPPRRLQPKTPRDLETICLKCLEKEPVKRYSSAAALAEDLHRFLEDRPIVARPVRPIERTWRWCRRNPAIALLTTTLALALLVGSGVSLYFGWKSYRHAKTVEKQRDELVQRNQELKEGHQREVKLGDRAQRIIEDMTSDEALGTLVKQKQLTPEQSAFLRNAVEYYQEVSVAAPVDMAGEERQARAIRRIGELQSDLGQYSAAKDSFRSAEELFAKLAAKYASEPRFRRDLADSYHSHGAMLFKLNQWAESRAIYETALPIRKQLVAEFPTDPANSERLASAYHNIAVLMMNMDEKQAARAPLEKALALRKQLADEQPDNSRYGNLVAQSHRNIGLLQLSTGSRAAARKSFEEALRIERELASKYPLVVDYRNGEALAYADWGSILDTLGDLPGAIQAYEQAVSVYRWLTSNRPLDPEHRYWLGLCQRNFGRVLEKAKDNRARSQYESAIVVLESIARDFGPSPQAQDALAESYVLFGNYLVGLGDKVNARSYYDKSLPLRQELAKAYPNETKYQLQLACDFVGQGERLVTSGRFAAALEALDQADAIFALLPEKKAQSTDALERRRSAQWCRAAALDRLKRYGDAAQHWEKAADLETDGTKQCLARWSSALSRVNAGDHAAAAAILDDLAKKQLNGEFCFEVARVYALACTQAKGDSQASGHYAVSAVKLLTKAKAEKLFDDKQNLDLLRKLPDFDALRQREDFRKLMQDFP